MRTLGRLLIWIDCKQSTQNDKMSATILHSHLNVGIILMKKDIEDIYSFAVNTINIVIECNESISIFTSAKHE